MTSKQLYHAIGDIDDSLIQAAAEVHGPQRTVRTFYCLAGIAACLCLLCGGLLLGLRRDVLYINELSVPLASKVLLPADETAALVPMTYAELLAYYGLEPLPDALGQDLLREDRSYFALYQDQAGRVLYDTNSLYYSSRDGSRSVSLTLARAEELSASLPKELKRSRIGGVSVLLASKDQAAYLAGFSRDGLSVQIVAYGLSESDFIDLVKELLRFVK